MALLKNATRGRPCSPTKAFASLEASTVNFSSTTEGKSAYGFMASLGCGVSTYLSLNFDGNCSSKLKPTLPDLMRPLVLGIVQPSNSWPNSS